MLDISRQSIDITDMLDIIYKKTTIGGNKNFSVGKPLRHIIEKIYISPENMLFLLFGYIYEWRFVEVAKHTHKPKMDCHIIIT